jgi:Uma2 family endonuclease
MSQELKTDLVTPAAGSSSVPRMTYEEFLEWYDEQHAEWVDGEVILMSPPTEPHQDLTLFLGALLRHFVEARQLGSVLVAPFQMKLEKSGREPDILFVSNSRLQTLKQHYLDGPANLAIEVMSPDSRVRDRRDKYREYELAGVDEYWILDPMRGQAKFYKLDATGAYAEIGIDQEGIFHSFVLAGLWLKVDWLWQEPVPTLMQVLKEWRLVKE